MSTLLERLCSFGIWTMAEAAETGRLVPQRILDAWEADRKEAAGKLYEMQELIRCLVENNPDEPISDGGHVVLDLWRHDARKALGLPEQNQH